MANVVAFDARPKELSDSEALDWLRLQPGGRAQANSVVLAERWGWSRYRVARRLKMWQAAGLITKQGKIVMAAARDDVRAAASVASVVAEAASATPLAPTETRGSVPAVAAARSAAPIPIAATAGSQIMAL